MTINFSRSLKIDIDNVPDDFEGMIQKNFAEYTEGTSSEFTYQDKLSYIDHMVDKLHKAGDEWTAVEDLLLERVQHQLNECGSLPDRDDFESIEFMQECYRKGREDGRLYCQFRDERGLVDHHVYEKIMKLECRAIRAVIDWEENRGEEEIGRWISRKEKLPRKGQDTLCCFDDGFIATATYGEDNLDDWALWADAGEVIAWMPLPKPYQSEVKKC